MSELSRVEIDPWAMASPLQIANTRPAKGLDRVSREAVMTILSRTPDAIEIQDAENVLAQKPAPSEPVARLRVHNPRFYREVVLRGSLGAADTYRKGDWDADDLTALFQIFLRRIGNESPLEHKLAWLGTFPTFVRHLLRSNNHSGARKHIEAHYDLGNAFFELFLDPTLTYSSGIFETPNATLQEASETKLRRICDKLRLRPGMSVVEIGSGWGSFAILAAKEYGCHVTSVTLSKSQQHEATRRVRQQGLESLAEIRLQDYRDLEGAYDRLVSIEMIEAIGHRRLGEYFAKCSALLRPDGAMAIQVITMPDQSYPAYLRRTDVIREYLFPGSNCPSRLAVLDAATQNSDLRMTHVEEIGRHYAQTLRYWRKAFVARLEEARAMGYSEEFLRLWHFYLCYCEAGFAEQHIGDVQMVFSKPKFAERDALVGMSWMPANAEVRS